MTNTYDMALEAIRISFECELCEYCNGDLDDHYFVEFLGNPLVMCKREAA